MSDLISRKAAIDALGERPMVWVESDYELGARNQYDADVLALETVPSAQPEQQWIPCSKQLPEDGATVWVTIKGHDVIRCEDGETLEQAIERINKIRWVTQGYWSEEEHGWNDPSYGCPLIVKPIAWMPIDTPEPYKGGEQDG